MREWFIKHQDAITWFVIGVCVMSGITSLAAGNYISAAINLGIAALNYCIRGYKMKL